jgi:FtsH-binding integral membrane protein
MFVKDMLFAVLALITAVIAAGSFYFYTRPGGDNKLYLAVCILFVLMTLVFGGLFLSGRVNKNDDIHITE